MADNANYLSTPDNYATPNQIKSTYDYAKALLYGNQQQPVHHWTQGISNMVNALVGGNLDYGAAQKERAASNLWGKQLMPEPPPGQPPTGQPQALAPPGKQSFDEAPPSGSLQNTAGGDFGLESRAIAGIESAGAKDPYKLVGPNTGKMGRAIGKYQVMEANVPEWTQAALGQPMTADQFKNSPEAQEAVFKHRFGQYEQKYGPEGAAKAWFAGERGMNNPNARDLFGTSVASYGNRFRMAGGGGDGQAPVQDVASRQAAPGVNNLAQPGPDQGPPLIPPGLVPHPPQFSRENVQGALGNLWGNPAQQEKLRDQYIQQSQPVQVPFMGGNVVVNPLNPNQQQYRPDVKWGTSEVGDIKRQIPQIVNSQGQLEKLQRAPVPTVGPRSEAEPQAAPAGAPAAPQGPFGPIPVINAGQPQAAPAAPAEPSKPVQVASAPPATGVPAEGPGSGSGPGLMTVAQQSLRQFGQTPPPPGDVDPEDWASYTGKKAFDTKAAVNQDAQLKAADFAAKKYDTLSTQAQAARSLKPNIDLGLALMNDPNFHTGMLSGVQDIWSRFKVAVLGDKFANAPNEVFDKEMASQVLGTMKTALGGLGQVRLAEINLLNKANANRTNTDASNRAVLEISRRALEKVDQLDGLGQQYASGDEVTDPISGKVLLKPNLSAQGEIEPRRGLDVGFDKLARKFILDNPSFNDAEVKHYETIFDTGRNPDEAQTTAPGKANQEGPGVVAPTFQPAPTGAIDYLKAHPESRSGFEKHFGPADKYLK